MKLSIGYSTCPNDTFIFDALIHNKVDTEGLEFTSLLTDVEELNQKALQQELDITKISFATYLKIANNYQLLNAGSALGKGVGPLLISKKKIYKYELKDVKIAIPGVNTTANLLLTFAFPEAQNKHQYLFSDIEEAVLSNEVDAGLIIHENRFTYKDKGLQKISDLGEFWEEFTGLPIPLGGIVVRRSLNHEVKLKIDRVLKRSVEFAFANPNESDKYVKKYAAELKDEVIKQHINLYVNNYSVDLGEEGRKAISILVEKAKEHNIADINDIDLFL